MADERLEEIAADLVKLFDRDKVSILCMYLNREGKHVGVVTKSSMIPIEMLYFASACVGKMSDDIQSGMNLGPEEADSVVLDSIKELLTFGRKDAGKFPVS